jgi:hypothetical protein
MTAVKPGPLELVMKLGSFNTTQKQNNVSKDSGSPGQKKDLMSKSKCQNSADTFSMSQMNL